MNTRQIVLSLVLLAFGAQTGFVFYQQGFGWIPELFATPLSITVFADLVIALSLICIWMVADARQRGTSAWGYLVLTLLAGSVGPLIYLIRREGQALEGSPTQAPAHV